MEKILYTVSLEVEKTRIDGTCTQDWTDYLDVQNPAAYLRGAWRKILNRKEKLLAVKIDGVEFWKISDAGYPWEIPVITKKIQIKQEIQKPKSTPLC
jgi:hypothetical protein